MKDFLRHLTECFAVAAVATLAVYMVGAFITMNLTWMPAIVTRIIFAAFFVFGVLFSDDKEGEDQ